MNERDFLKNFAKILKAEDTFEAIEEQRQREQKKLEQLSAAPAATSFCPAIPSAILTVTEAAL